MAGKKFKDFVKDLDLTQQFKLSEAIELLKKADVLAKFDQSIDVSVRLGVDPRHADQQVRGTVLLPAGTGKKIRVAVFAKGDKVKEAEAAGADFVGGEDLVKRIQEESFLDFEATVATPDMMGQVGRIGKVLGPRGLMPNPKLGTVTFDVGDAVRELKAGRTEFKVDKQGNVHCAVGKVSFSTEDLDRNLRAFLDALLKAKPSGAKGAYIRSIYVSTTMGPGIQVEGAEAERSRAA